MTKLRDSARRWWDRQPAPLRASAATLVWAFLGSLGAQAMRLADDMHKWLFTAGPEPDWLSTGSAMWSAVTLLLAGIGNLLYRSRRPAAYWLPAPTGLPVDTTPPRGDL